MSSPLSPLACLGMRLLVANGIKREKCAGRAISHQIEVFGHDHLVLCTLTGQGGVGTRSTRPGAAKGR
jgi:hypothetical protein